VAHSYSRIARKNRRISIIHDEDMVKRSTRMIGREWGRKTRHQLNFCIPRECYELSVAQRLSRNRPRGQRQRREPGAKSTHRAVATTQIGRFRCARRVRRKRQSYSSSIVATPRLLPYRASKYCLADNTTMVIRPPSSESGLNTSIAFYTFRAFIERVASRSAARTVYLIRISIGNPFLGGTRERRINQLARAGSL